MAISFDWAVYDGGNNADGLTWATAYQSITTALAAASAGETIAIASDHSEAALVSSVSAIGIGTSADPLIIVTLDRTDDTYENMVTGGGRIVQSGTGSDWSLGAWVVWTGLDIFVADNLIAQSAGTSHLIDCKIEVSDETLMDNSSHHVHSFWENVHFVQKTNSSGFTCERGSFFWRGGSLTFNGGTLGNFILTATEGTNAIIEDVDLSALSGNLVEASSRRTNILFKRCKFHVDVTLVNGTISNENFFVKSYSCSSADIVYQFHEASFYGTVEDDSSVYLDATCDGSTGYSAKMVTNASTLEFYKPLKFKLADIWVAANQVLTAEMLTDNVTLQNDEFWIEVEYPDATTKIQGNVLSSKLGASSEATWTGVPDDSAANLSASAKGAGDWTGESGTPVYQKIDLTISGGEEGVHTVWACLAKPSTTVYVCPKITVA